MKNIFRNIKFFRLMILYIILMFIFIVSDNLLHPNNDSGEGSLDLIAIFTNGMFILWFFQKLKSEGIDILAYLRDGVMKITFHLKEIFRLIIGNMVFSMGASLLLVYLLFRYNRPLYDQFMSNKDTIVPKTENSLMITTLYAVVFAPIFEEFMCRGVMISRFAPKIKLVGAIIVSSLIFAALHIEMAFFGAFTFGLVMCVLYIKTRNIFVTVFAHTLNNIIAMLIQNLTFESSNLPSEPTNPEDMISVGIFGGTVVLISGIFIINYLYKNWPRKKDKSFFEEVSDNDIKEVSGY